MPDTNHPSAVAIQEETRNDVPRWQRLLAGLGATIAAAAGFAALVLVAWGWVEGSPEPRGPIAPAVVDEAHLLSPEAIRAIESTKFPADVPVLVRTVDAPASMIVGAAATNRMETEAYWETVRPRSWHQRTIKRNYAWGTGVYVLVSKSPALVQVRFGGDIRLRSYRTGLAAGPDYRRIQEAYAASPADTEVVALVADLSRRLPPVLTSGWLSSIAHRLASVAFSEIEEFVLPSDGAFRQGAVRVYVGVARRLGATSSGWRFLVFTALCYCVIWLAAYFVRTSLGRRFKVAGAIAGGVLSILSKAVYLVGALGSLLLLANGRTEDQLLLRDLGLQQLQWVGFDGAYLSAPGGWLLSIVTGATALFSSLLTAIEGVQEGRERGETSIDLSFLIAPFAWGALVLLLPRALGVFALFNRIAAGVGSVGRLARR
jgi:hypothetical protein